MSEGESTVLFRALSSEKKLSAGEKRALRSFTRVLQSRVTDGHSFVCVMADDLELRRLNKTFLGHDYATDVLSFPAEAGSDELGELIISVERAEAQARTFEHDRISEICILMLHGVLHLCGLDHAKDGGEMERAEQRWREQLNLPLTLIARSKPQPDLKMARARRVG